MENRFILISKCEVTILFPLHVFEEWVSVSFEAKGVFAVSPGCKAKLWGVSIPYSNLLKQNNSTFLLWSMYLSAPISFLLKIMFCENFLNHCFKINIEWALLNMHFYMT